MALGYKLCSRANYKAVHLQIFYHWLIDHKYIIGDNWLTRTSIIHCYKKVNFAILSVSYQLCVQTVKFTINIEGNIGKLMY